MNKSVLPTLRHIEASLLRKDYQLRVLESTFDTLTEILLSMEQRFEMFGMKLSIINQNTTKNIPKNLLKPRPDEKGETCSQQA